MGHLPTTFAIADFVPLLHEIVCSRFMSSAVKASPVVEQGLYFVSMSSGLLVELAMMYDFSFFTFQF